MKKKENKNGIIVTDLYDGKLLKCRFDIKKMEWWGKSGCAIVFSVSHMDERFRNTSQKHDTYGTMCYNASNGFKVRSEMHPQLSSNAEVFLRGFATQNDDNAFQLQTTWSVLECRAYVLKCIDALREWERCWDGFKEETVKKEMSLKEFCESKKCNMMKDCGSYITCKRHKWHWATDGAIKNWDMEYREGVFKDCIHLVEMSECAEWDNKEVKEIAYGAPQFNCQGCHDVVTFSNRSKHYGLCNKCADKKDASEAWEAIVAVKYADKQQKPSKPKKSNILLLMKEMREKRELLNQYEVEAKELTVKVNETVGRISLLKEEAKKLIEGI